MKLAYILDWYISWTLKRQWQPGMYFMGRETCNAHEILIKA